MIGFWVAGTALILAAILYFVFLPHIEGPSLDEQRADKTQILVCCPKCQKWQVIEPVSSTAADPEKINEPTETNWFRCRSCKHRWAEERVR
ncbi:MAG: hypothetical protein AAGD96_13735 [Chloroflexota bacterium]